MKKLLVGLAALLFSALAQANCVGITVTFGAGGCGDQGSVSGSGASAQGGSGAVLLGIAGQASGAQSSNDASAGVVTVATPLGGFSAGGSQSNSQASQGSISGALGLAAAGGTSQGAAAGIAGQQGGFGFTNFGAASIFTVP